MEWRIHHTQMLLEVMRERLEHIARARALGAEAETLWYNLVRMEQLPGAVEEAAAEAATETLENAAVEAAEEAAEGPAEAAAEEVAEEAGGEAAEEAGGEAMEEAAEEVVEEAAEGQICVVCQMVRTEVDGIVSCEGGHFQCFDCAGE